MAKQGMQAAVGVVITLIVIAALVPTALDLFFNANTSGWDSSIQSLWPVIPLLAILALVIVYASDATDRL